EEFVMTNLQLSRAFLVGVGLLFITLLFWPTLLVGQTVTGTLQGTVIDSNKAYVPGAEITLRNVDTGQERKLTTNNEGFYVSTFLPVGRYNVSVATKGFRTTVRENIEVSLNQTRVVDFSLEPSAVSEAVIVTAEAAPINTTNGEIKGSLNRQEILDRPV